MVQKLGAALSLPTLKRIVFSPPAVNYLFHYFRFQWGVKSDEDASGGTISAGTSGTTIIGGQALGVGEGTMDKTDLVHEWVDSFDNTLTVKAVQTTSADKPEWNTYSLAPLTEKPMIFFDGNTFMDINTDITIAAEQDFTIMAHVIFTDLTARAMYGSNANNFFRINTSASFRCKIGGSGNSNFTEASDTITTNKDYFVTLQRSGGASGRLACYVHADDLYDDKAWGSTGNEDPDEFSINNIGASSDDTSNFKGVFKNLFIYKGAALTSDNRKTLYTYMLSLL
jgi:hypothetical protein